MKSKSILGRPVEFSLRLIGAWPKSSHTILQRVIWSIGGMIFLTLQYCHVLTHFQTQDLAELLDGLSLTLSDTLLFFKLIIIWINIRIFYEVIMIIDDDWNKYGTSDWNVRIMTKNITLSSRFSHSIVGIYSMTLSSYAASTLMPSDDLDKGAISNERKFLLKMMFPFEATISPIYEIILLIQFVVQWSVTYMASMTMALSMALILHVGGQIDILCRELEEISNYSHTGESCLPQLKSIISKHQMILYLTDSIEYVFTYISLIQFLSNIVVMCFLGFHVVTSLGTEDGSAILAKCLPYYIAMIFEAFIFCFTGEYLTSKSENITTAAYDVLWYELSPRESRFLILLILRSQRRLTITVGKFMNLSLETFANMIKASASYLSVLRAMC